MIFTDELISLALIAFVGIFINWLLVLAIQRKTYYYQQTHRTIIAATATTVPLLRRQASASSTSTFRQPFHPSSRSTMSSFDKHVLAFLINDILTCNFLLPLRLVDLSQGLPSVFLCFLMKFFEKLSIITELVVLTLLIVSSFLFFSREQTVKRNIYFLILLLMTPLIILYFVTTLIWLDVYESDIDGQSQVSCKRTFAHVNVATAKTLTMLCAVFTYALLLLHLALITRMKSAIRNYTMNTLKTFTEASGFTRNNQADTVPFDQNTNEIFSRRSIFIPATHYPSGDLAWNTNQRSIQSCDYLGYLSMIENSQTLIRSTYLLLIILFLVYIPYWLSESTSLIWSHRFKDLYFLSHCLKPICYVATNEKYRLHILAILQCKPFRVLPNFLRQRSRPMKKSYNNFNANSNGNDRPEKRAHWTEEETDSAGHDSEEPECKEEQLV